MIAAVCAAAAVMIAVRLLGRSKPRQASPAHPPRAGAQGVSRQRRSKRRAVADLPAMIELFVVAVRGGMLPVQAIRHLHDFVPVSLAAAVADVIARLDEGSRFADALDVLIRHVGPAAQPFVEALRMAELHGLPMAPVLERLSAEARQQRRTEADAAARQLPVRLSLPLVTCSLSSFVVLAIVPLLLGALSSLHQATPLSVPHRLPHPLELR